MASDQVTFKIPYVKTKITHLKTETGNLPTISNYSLPTKQTFSLLGGFVEESYSRSSILGVKEELPKTVQEVFDNLSRIKNNPSGKGNKVFNQKQIKEIAENLGLINSDNRNAGKAQLVELIRQHILGLYHLSESDVKVRETTKVKSLSKKTTGVGRGRGKK